MMEIHPPLLSPAYKSTLLRAPIQAPLLLPHSMTELTGPALGEGRVTEADSDLSVVDGGEAQGQRIVVHGQVRDSDGRPVPHTLVEVWQANAGGRYRFVTIKPGAYPWGNHPNAWRPAHIHFSLFGQAFTQRLVTQMYFPDDPLFAYDPIFNSVPSDAGRRALIAAFDLTETVEAWALGFRFDIVLRGRDATPMEQP